MYNILLTIDYDIKNYFLYLQPWRSGRVVECTGLENQRGSHLRGFESLLLRKTAALII